jgi:hypothetical protein
VNELQVRSSARPWEAASERGRAALERFPDLYIRIARRRTPARLGVDASTDLLIEGFPRSGNSFLVSWIAKANPGLRIASHMHSIAHVHAALRRRLPVVVVIREPEAALASLALFDRQRPIEQHIERYRRFHVGVLAVCDEVLVSPFTVTTGQPERVVEALRPAMVRDLVATPPGGVDAVMAEVDRRTVRFNGVFDANRVARPTDARSAANERVRDLLRTRHCEALAVLDALHDRLASGPRAITAR